MFGINQFQSFAYLFQSDAAAAFVLPGFGVVAVLYFAAYRAICIPGDGDADKAVSCRTDAVFKGIFYQRNKDVFLLKDARIYWKIFEAEEDKKKN